MSTKTLKVKRVFAYAIYNNLKNTPPKDFPTTGEIRSTISNVLPALREHLSEYIDRMHQAEEIARKIRDKALGEKEAQDRVDAINEGWSAYNRDHGSDIVEVSLDEEGLKTLRSQFDRESWGKKWLANLEEFAELLEAFDEAGK